ARQIAPISSLSSKPFLPLPPKHFPRDQKPGSLFRKFKTRSGRRVAKSMPPAMLAWKRKRADSSSSGGAMRAKQKAMLEVKMPASMLHWNESSLRHEAKRMM